MFRKSPANGRSVPSPSMGEGQGEGDILRPPHLSPLPPGERRLINTLIYAAIGERIRKRGNNRPLLIRVGSIQEEVPTSISPTALHLPVEPCPPAPRPVGVNSSTSIGGRSASFEITSWAIRSPCFISKSIAGLKRYMVTMTSPR